MMGRNDFLRPEVRLELLRRLRPARQDSKTRFKKTPVNSIKISAKKVRRLTSRTEPEDTFPEAIPELPESTTLPPTPPPEQNNIHDYVVQNRSRPVQVSQYRIIKNLVVLSLAFVVLFTSYISLASVMSSINGHQGMGVTCMSVIYGFLILACLFWAPPFIACVGPKRAMGLSILAYGTLFVANFYPSWWTLVPTSAILGIGASSLWGAKCVYLSKLAEKYALVTNQRTDRTLSLFFGIFFMFYQSTQIWGNLVTYDILKPTDDETTKASFGDSTSDCGINFCDSSAHTNNTNLLRPPDAKIYALCSVYTVLCFCASVFIFLCLDPFRSNRIAAADGKPKPSLFLATLKHLLEPYQVLLIPLTIYSGLEQAFIVGDFTKAFVTCSWGVHNVGHVMMSFGAADILCSITVGVLKIDRLFTFIFAVIVNAASLVTMLYYQPTEDSGAFFFLLAAAWGSADAVWQTQINAIYASLFPSNREAAFSNYRLWESVGFLVAYSLSHHLCMDVKVKSLAVWLSLSFVCYLALEIHSRTRIGRGKEDLPTFIVGEETVKLSVPRG